MSNSTNGVPKGWVRTTLGDIIVTRVEQRKPDNSEELTYIDIGSIDNSTKAVGECRLISGSDAPSRARQRVKSGDVLVSMTRPNLNAVARVPNPTADYIASTGFDVLRPLEIPPDWLFAHVRSREFVNEMSRLVQGALYPAVKSNDVRSFEIGLPPVPEQRRIVEKIESLQARSKRAREALEAVPPLLEKFRQSVLAAAFRGDLTKDWREQHKNDLEPASVLLKRIRAERRKKWEEAQLAKYEAKGKKPPKNWEDKYQEPEPIKLDEASRIVTSSVPENWCYASLNEIADLFTGKTPSTTVPDYWKGEIPFITPSQIHPKGHILPAERYVTSEGAEKARLLPRGAVLIVCIGSVGKSGLLDKAAIFNQQINAAVASPLIDGNYLFRWCQALCPWIQKVAAATVNAAILNKTGLGTAPIPLASLREQEVIASKVADALAFADEVERSMSQGSTSITTLDQSILAKAFRGELVPQDPNDEPASVLLERIRAQREAEATTKPKRKRKAKRHAKS